MNRQETADWLKRRVAVYYKRKARVCFFELGLNPKGRLRADVFVLAMSGHIVVVEVKSSVPDFKAGVHKWVDGYMPLCNQFYCAVTTEIFAKIKALIPKGVGVFIFDESDGRKKPKILKAVNRKLDPELSRSLFIRAAFRNSDTTNRKNRRA